LIELLVVRAIIAALIAVGIGSRRKNGTLPARSRLK
jgi:hypothetical protein